MRAKPFKASRKVPAFSRANALLASPLLFVRNIGKSWGNESIAIGHLNLRQRLRIQYVVFFDDVALGEDEGGKRVDLIRAERSSLIARHRAVDIVPDRGRVRPVTPEGSDGPKCGECFDFGLATRQARANLGAFGILAVAYSALRGKDRRAFLRCSLSGRESLSVRPGGDVPGLNFFFCRRSAHIRVGGRLRQRRARRHQDDSSGEKLRKAHSARSRRGLPSKVEW